MTSFTFATSANKTTPAYVGEEVVFYATAVSDIVGATLTFQFFFDAVLPPLPGTNNTASPTSINTTGNPGSVVTTFTYDQPGTILGSAGTYFIAKAYVSDGSGTVSAQTAVYVVENRPPAYLVDLPPEIPDAAAGVPMNISATVTDIDDDSLVMTWNFGDGSPEVVNTTGPAAGGVFVMQTHTWNPEVDPGVGNVEFEYYLNVSLEDNAGNVVNRTVLVSVIVPENYGPAVDITVSDAIADPADVLTFYATAVDPEGDQLTWTFDFGDGTLAVYHTDETIPSTMVWTNTTHIFGVEGTYQVRVYVSDALIPFQVLPHNRSDRVDVLIVTNRVPSVQDTLTYSEENPIINSMIGGIVVRFAITAGDADGDVLTAVWDFDDGSEVSTNVTPGGTDYFKLVQYHNFTETGSCNVTVTITDGREGHEVVRYKVINVISDNRPPYFSLGIRIDYPRGDYAQPNETIGITITISDREKDPVFLTVILGDGSPWVNVTLSEYVDRNVTYSLSHSYSSIGTKSLTIFITDGKVGIGVRPVYNNVSVMVAFEASSTSDDWTWWDYTSLGLFCMIPVLVIVWYAVVRRRLRELEDAGLTVEQYMAQKKEISSILKERRGR